MQERIRAHLLVLTKAWTSRAALAIKGSFTPHTYKQMWDQGYNSAVPRLQISVCQKRLRKLLGSKTAAALPAAPSFLRAPTKETSLLSELCPTQESSARERSPGPAAASLLSADTASELPTPSPLSVGSSSAACEVVSLLLSTAFSSMPALPGPATLDLREDRRRQGRRPLPAVPVHGGGPGWAGPGPGAAAGPFPAVSSSLAGVPAPPGAPRSRHAPRPRPAFGRHLAAGSPPPPPRARTRRGGPGAAGAGETPPRRSERISPPLPACQPAPLPGPPRPRRTPAGAGTTAAAIAPRPLAAQ